MPNQWDIFVGVRWGWSSSKRIGLSASKDYRGAWDADFVIYKWRVFKFGRTASGKRYFSFA